MFQSRLCFNFRLQESCTSDFTNMSQVVDLLGEDLQTSLGIQGAVRYLWLWLFLAS